jgi:hypothetical protein
LGQFQQHFLHQSKAAFTQMFLMLEKLWENIALGAKAVIKNK